MGRYIGNQVEAQGADTTIYLPVRQTALIGELSATGTANSLSAGSGLRVTLTATANPLVLAIANGFGNYGGQDRVAKLSADDSDIIGADLAVDNTNYIYADYVDTDEVTWGDTLAPPQYRQFYDQSRQANLHFEGTPSDTTTLDDYGNTWTAQAGAQIVNDQTKVGSTALGGGGTSNALNGTTDFFETTDITSLSPDGWTIECWVRPTVLPSSGDTMCIANFGQTTTRFGAQLQIFNDTGTIRWAYSLSSNTTADDIALRDVGSTLPVVDTWYHFALTWDKLAGTYRMYIDGTQETSTVSALQVCGGVKFTVGGRIDDTRSLQGYVDEFMYRPYCAYPDGTAFTAPTAAFDVTTDISSNFFSIPQMKMFSVTAASAGAGVDPTFTQVNRVYVGEADTDGSSVTAVRNYAYQDDSKVNRTSSAAAAWITLDMVAGTILDSFNIRNINKNSTGRWFITMDNPMPNADYCVIGSKGEGGTFVVGAGNDLTAPTTTTFELTSRTAAGTYTDIDWCFAVVYTNS